MTLREYFKSFDRFNVVPILGYAGLKIGGLNAQQCLHDPKLHAELVKSNLKHFEPDAVISLMDLTVEAESYGIKPQFKDYDPPEIRTHIPLDKVTEPQRSGARIDIMVEAARQISQQVKDIPTGFFVTGPFTLAGQIVGLEPLLMGLYQSRETTSKLIENCTEMIIDYVKRLEETGISFLVLADMSSSLISPKDFEQSVKTPISRVVKEFSNDVVLHMCGRTSHLLKHLGETGAAAISIDQNVPLPNAVEAVPSEMLVFGNYSPVGLMSENTSTITSNVTRMVSAVNPVNVIASSGCDIPSQTPPENIKTFIQAVKSYKKT